MVKTSKVRFSIPGASASRKEGPYGYFQGSYSAILVKLAELGLGPHNYSIHYISTNSWALFYYKPGSGS